MSTSGSYDFAITRNDIIAQALDECGIAAIGQTISAEDMAKATLRLNLMVKAWMARGYRLWGIQEATLFLAPGTASYSIGPTGSHCTASYVQTTLSAAAAGGVTTLSLAATTGISAADYIGVVLDSGALHWTTVSNPAGTTIASGLASPAAAGNVVYAYTSKLQRPLRVVPDSVYWRDINGSDTPVRDSSRIEYAQQTAKASRGKVVQAWYEPTLVNGTLRVWPAPDLATDVLRFSCERPLQDFDAATDNPDFPIEWGEPLIWGLADCMSVGLPLPDRDRIRAIAAEKLDIALGFDRDTGSVYFGAETQ